MVSTADALFGVNPETGKLLWQRTDLRDLRNWPEKGICQLVAGVRTILSVVGGVRKFSGANYTIKSSSQPSYPSLAV